MTLKKVKSIQDVVDWGLCIGCGACYDRCETGAVSLRNIESVGIRPVIDQSRCGDCRDCLDVCPGHDVDAGRLRNSVPTYSDPSIGRYLEIWEGHAVDPEINRRASSGGLLTALALYCLQEKGMKFALHAGMDPEKPWQNRTCQSHNREELTQRAGSRYSPASPCDSLKAIEAAEGECVFIGKPCDTAAVEKSRSVRPSLDRNLGLVLSFFCAGTPSTEGTNRLLQDLGIDRREARSIQYRGDGWPGGFKVNTATQEKFIPYEESWSRLTKFKPFRCQLCPDGLGNVADLACGDAWHEYREGAGQLGKSIVIVRTERGREILHGAIQAQYVQLRPIRVEDVIRAQANLLQKKNEIFGRILAMTLFGIPAPRFRGFFLFRNWFRLALWNKVRTVAGTVKRIFKRKLYQKKEILVG